jgi:hypothetical protein
MSTWVELHDIDENKIVAWAQEHCPSFCSWLIYEGESYAGVDLDPIRYKFEFYNEQDAMLFQLKWQGQ